VRIAPAAIAAAAMTVVGLWGLARQQAMANDEAATSIAARLSLGQLATLLRHIDAVHGLYYLLMHGWVAIGSSAEALRVPSLIAMIVSAALVTILATSLSGSRLTGLFAGLIMAATPSISYYGQTARSYAMVFGCVTGATILLVTALRAEVAGPGSRIAARSWLGYAALVALGGYLNEMALLVLAAHGVTVLLSRCQRAVLWRWARAGLIGAALVIPLGLLSLVQHSDVSWIGRPNLIALRVLSHDYFGVTGIATGIVVACIVVALLPEGARWWRGGISVPSVALPLLVIPAALLLGESLVGKALYVDRYVLYGEAGAAVLAAAGLYRIGQWLGGRQWPGRPGKASGRAWPIWVLGALACAAVFAFQLGPQRFFRTPDSRLFDFTAPARYIGASARHGDGVLFFDTFFRKDLLLYPGDFRRTSDFAQAQSPALVGTFRGTDKSFAATRPLMLAQHRIWVVGDVPSAHLADPYLRQQSQLLLADFRLVRQRDFQGIDVTLWVRR
jgi:mannosyltransferase